VAVTGTTVTLSGASALVLGQTTTLSILLRDSGGNGIPNEVVTLSSSQGNTLSAPAVTTDFNGQASVTVTATVSGTDTIEAVALGASGPFSLTVSSANFRFSTPASGAEVNLNTNQTIIVHWDEAGVNQVGQTINFLATRGTLIPASAITDSSGNATVIISSTNAGLAAITATAATSGGPSSQITIEFVATTPTSLIVQANPTSLGVNAGGSTDQQSIVTAVVRDASGNLVKNQIVSFTLTDNTSGSIFPASAITDSFGQASTVYTAGAVPSAQDGVRIDARVGGITSTVQLTVAQQSLFVTLGTGNLIQPLSDTQYAKPYSVLVSDANSNPVAGVSVELNIFPTRYQKGVYVQLFDSITGTFISWVKQFAPPPTTCNNEDVNRNGILDTGDMDTNNNGELEPGNIAAVPITVTTDATGFAFFDVVYAREFTWAEVELEARATVAGSESSSKAKFFLPGLATDFDQEDVSPPGVVSPFGTATTCADPS
jgi:hypothetical protein